MQSFVNSRFFLRGRGGSVVRAIVRDRWIPWVRILVGLQSPRKVGNFYARGSEIPTQGVHNM